LRCRPGKLGYFRRHKDLMGFLHFDFYRPSDVCLLLLLAYTVVLHFLDLPLGVYVGCVLFLSPRFLCLLFISISVTHSLTVTQSCHCLALLPLVLPGISPLQTES
jgi:hypothetical protein